MLNVLSSSLNEFHNLKCGEIYCVNPTNYNVICYVCGQKQLFDEFLQHFQNLHLYQEEPIVNHELEIVVEEVTIEKTVIKSEKDRNDNIFSEVGQEWNVDGFIKFAEVQLPKLDCKNGNSFIPEHNALNCKCLEDTEKEDDLENATECNIDGIHKKNETFTCTVCSLHYKAKHGLLQHMRRCHQKDEAKEAHFKCAQCNDSFRSERAVRIHAIKHVRVLKRLRNLNTRSKGSIGVRTSKRQVEKTTLEYDKDTNKSNKFIAKQNVVDLKGIEPTEIENSNKESSADGFADDCSKIKLEEDGKFSCTMCSRFYKAKRTLQHHLRKDHNIEATKKITNINAKCNECGEIFRYQNDLRKHMSKHGRCSCDICGKSFANYGNMKLHQKRHTGIRSFKCEHCEGSYYTKKELVSHEMKHTGALPFICEVCGRSFRNSSKLTEHMRRHTGERPAKCKICGKCYYSSYDLIVHSVTHSTERPFICSICLSTFQTKKALRVHKKNHTGERKHLCKLCSKTFTQIGALNAHMMGVHSLEIAT